METEHGAFVSPAADRPAVLESVRANAPAVRDHVRYAESVANVRRRSDELTEWRPRDTDALANALRERTDVAPLYAVKHPPGPYEGFAAAFLDAASPPVVIVDAPGSWTDALAAAPVLSTARLDPAGATGVGSAAFGDALWQWLPKSAAEAVADACRHLTEGDGEEAAARAEEAARTVLEPAVGGRGDAQERRLTDGELADAEAMGFPDGPGSYGELRSRIERARDGTTDTGGSDTGRDGDGPAELAIQDPLVALFHAKSVCERVRERDGP